MFFAFFGSCHYVAAYCVLIFILKPGEVRFWTISISMSAINLFVVPLNPKQKKKEKKKRCACMVLFNPLAFVFFAKVRGRERGKWAVQIWCEACGHFLILTYVGGCADSGQTHMHVYVVIHIWEK